MNNVIRKFYLTHYKCHFVYHNREHSVFNICGNFVKPYLILKHSIHSTFSDNVIIDLEINLLKFKHKQTGNF
jgi:hypothetical protein